MFKRGEVYYINKMVSNGTEQQGGRPAVIVSNDVGNSHCNGALVVFMTTKAKNNLPTHTEVRCTKKTSIVLCEQVRYVDAESIGDFVACVSDEEMQEINKCLSISLGLTNYIHDEAMKYAEKTAVPDDANAKAKLTELERKMLVVETQRDTYKAIVETTIKSA